MNDRQDPYAPQDPYAQDRRERPVYGYDAYGQPVYAEDGTGGYDPYAQQAQAPYDPYAGQQQAQGHGYDPYGAQASPQSHYQQQTQYPQQYDPYAQPQQPQQVQHPQHPQHPQTYHPQQPYQDQPYQDQPYQEQQPQQAQPRPQQQDWIPQQAQPSPYEQATYESRLSPEQPRTPPRSQSQPPPSEGPEAPPRRSATPDYRTEQFAFIEEPDEGSEDVIDWLKFSESRTERREEAKRRGRSRVVALFVVLALLVVGGVGYLWWADKIPGLSDSEDGAATAGAAQKRDVLVVHLRETKGGASSTALLVDNETTRRGTTVLLPNNLVVPAEDGTSTTLGASMKDAGAAPTRESLNTLLGADIKASWRLDTPYLENLVETVGGIDVDTDTAVLGEKKGDDPLVKPGKGQTLNGRAAVAYATHRGEGEAQSKQLERFGRVLHATLKKVSSEASGATATVKSLFQVLDPPLTEAQLGSALAERAELAKSGAYDTTLLPVRQDGTLSEQATEDVVKGVLGGTVKKTDPDATARVSVRDASGDKGAVARAQAALINGGYSFVDGGAHGAARPTSEVTYADDAQKARAEEVAKTLGLPEGSVKKGRSAANADVTVVLGKDYKG